MTRDEEEKLFDGLVTLTEMLKQVQTTVLANQAVMLAHLAAERLSRGDAWMEELRGSASATLADVLLDYGSLAKDISERTKQILDNIADAKVMTNRDQN